MFFNGFPITIHYNICLVGYYTHLIGRNFVWQSFFGSLESLKKNWSDNMFMSYWSMYTHKAISSTTTVLNKDRKDGIVICS
jgi:hypothetical protein